MPEKAPVRQEQNVINLDTKRFNAQGRQIFQIYAQICCKVGMKSG